MGKELGRQLGFILYQAARTATRSYKPYLDVVGITYTQYFALMVLSETPNISMVDLGNCLALDSSTLTPLTKKLISAGYVTKNRDTDDERVVRFDLTEEGKRLCSEFEPIGDKFEQSLDMSPSDLATLKRLLSTVNQTVM